MNFIKLFFCFVLLSISGHVAAEIGCMDNSKHAQELFDYKTYHYVQCNCDCKQHEQSSDRNICSNCGHYHEAQEKIICKYRGN